MAMISGVKREIIDGVKQKTNYDVADAEEYDVYALCGKLMNVRSASAAEIKRNVVIQKLKETIGLRDKMTYDRTNTLQYKHVILMTDPDNDGAHIIGLFINLLITLWPSLLKVKPPFVSWFKTPLITVCYQNIISVIIIKTPNH